jgi:hypothetical protein
VDLDCRIYPGLGHSFLMTSPDIDPDGAELARESWDVVLAHLTPHLARAD